MDTHPTHRQQAGWGKRQQAAALHRLRRPLAKVVSGFSRSTVGILGTGCFVGDGR